MQPAGRARGTGRQQIGPLTAAAIEGLRAAWVEGAAGGDGGQPRHRAVDLHQPLALMLHRRDRAHQPDGVGMRRVVNHLGHPGRPRPPPRAPPPPPPPSPPPPPPRAPPPPPRGGGGARGGNPPRPRAHPPPPAGLPPPPPGGDRPGGR